MAAAAAKIGSATPVVQEKCTTCEKLLDQAMRCTACYLETVRYCGIECQKADRKRHKDECFEGQFFHLPNHPVNIPLSKELLRERLEVAKLYVQGERQRQANAGLGAIALTKADIANAQLEAKCCQYVIQQFKELGIVTLDASQFDKMFGLGANKEEKG